MDLAKCIKDYVECTRTEKQLNRLMRDMYFNGYRSIKEADKKLSIIYGLLEHAKELNRTSSCGVIGYIRVKRLTHLIYGLEQKVEDNWFSGIVPIDL
jgi:hypothetical protein